MNNKNKFDDFINNHPKESLQILIILFFILMQTIPALIGFICYGLLARKYKLQWWIILPLGVLILATAIMIEHQSVVFFIKNGFIQNFIFWKYLSLSQPIKGFCNLFTQSVLYVIALPLFIAGLLSTSDLIQKNAHKDTLLALQKGIFAEDKKEVSEKVITAALNKLKNTNDDGSVLGVSKFTGKYLTIQDRDINQVLLVLGTTGAGKTITLRRFYLRAIKKGYPLIVVDAKPDADNIQWLQKLAEQSGRKFYGFNCTNYYFYDALANGGYTELKDKIISLKDEWSSEHYRSIAEVYLQATFEVLLKSGKICDLATVVQCLNY